MPIITSQNAGTTCSSAPPIGRKISSPVNMPSMPIQRGSRPTRMAFSDVADHARRQREPREQVDVVDDDVRRALR